MANNDGTKLDMGLVQVYTGDGKGKTTASIGLCVRAVGVGLKALVVQFMKGKNLTGELASTKKFGSQFIIKQFGSGNFNFGTEPTEEEIKTANEGLALIEKHLSSGLSDIVVLDEVSHAINLGLLKVDDVVRIIQQRQSHVEVVLTGRKMPAQLVEIADLISEIKAVRHPFEKGIKARTGIEG